MDSGCVLAHPYLLGNLLALVQRLLRTAIEFSGREIDSTFSSMAHFYRAALRNRLHEYLYFHGIPRNLTLGSNPASANRKSHPMVYIPVTDQAAMGVCIRNPLAAGTVALSGKSSKWCPACLFGNSRGYGAFHRAICTTAI